MIVVEGGAPALGALVPFFAVGGAGGALFLVVVSRSVAMRFPAALLAALLAADEETGYETLVKEQVCSREIAGSYGPKYPDCALSTGDGCLKISFRSLCKQKQPVRVGGRQSKSEE
ncbi:hypothetical protein F2Q69_00018695 [Brassica cretica]|uniref:Uncharacterized protein n=1 Tax=Brassica cretica TaxID=69181 RepID=A0A8S9QEB1_BRACR|nr:hypothetical protein F2Q69_00018695 [Brassica cretica]